MEGPPSAEGKPRKDIVKDDIRRDVWLGSRLPLPGTHNSPRTPHRQPPDAGLSAWLWVRQLSDIPQDLDDQNL